MVVDKSILLVFDIMATQYKNDKPFIVHNLVLFLKYRFQNN